MRMDSLSIASVRKAFEDVVTIERELGRGRFGRVYSGTYHGNRVAVKVLDTSALDEQLFTYFMHEFANLRNLSSPHVMRVYDAGIRDDRPFLISEYSGTHPVLEKGRVDPEAVQDMAFQLITGIRDYQRAGIIHRDLSPRQILRTDEGVYKIIDLGLGYKRHELADNPMGFFGTPLYAAPEQFDLDYYPESDVYSWAVILYEVLAGRLPYAVDLRAKENRTFAALKEAKKQPHVRLRTLRPEAPGDLADVIEESLVYTPGEGGARIAGRLTAEEAWYYLERRSRGQPVLSMLNADQLDAVRPDPAKPHQPRQPLNVLTLSDWKEDVDNVTLPDCLDVDGTEWGVIDTRERRLERIEAPQRGGKTRIAFSLEVLDLYDRGDIGLAISGSDIGTMKAGDGDVFRLALERDSARLEYWKFKRRRAEKAIPFPRGRTAVAIERFSNAILFAAGDDYLQVDQPSLTPSAQQEIWVSAKNLKARLGEFRLYHERGGSLQDPGMAIRRSYAEGDFDTAIALAATRLYDLGSGDPRAQEARLLRAKSIIRTPARTRTAGQAALAWDDLASVEQGDLRLQEDARREMVYFDLFINRNYRAAARRIQELYQITQDREGLASWARWLSGLEEIPRDHRALLRQRPPLLAGPTVQDAAAATAAAPATAAETI
ncbi:MAG: serine/threonine protein kinase [Candidatus Aenigmarchaeota archaeon]|nr:serine/threonine protein kinase [Candidatus Aenigmarchaeota archaeon]